MFKSARWRSEKNKIKAVFRLQFHATQLPGDGLVLSVVPADSGKPTVRLEKPIFRDGSCYWENAVYETVKFVQEPKTGKIHERIYHFVLSTGTSKAGLLGDVSIDFAKYAEAIKVSSVSLPLKNAKSETVLHVLIQRMQEHDDQREVEEGENANVVSKDRSLKSQLSNGGDTDGGIKNNSTEDGPLNKTNSHIAELNGVCRASSVSDITVSSSESSSGIETPRELGIKNNNGYPDPTGFSVGQKPTLDASSTIYEEQQRSQWDWLGSSAPEVSTDDSSSSLEDAVLRERSQEAPDIVIEKLKTELSLLSRQAEVSELELQTLRKQIVKESKRGQDLFKEVISLKDERYALKEECEKLEMFRKRMDEAKVKNTMQFEGGDSRALLEELREELNYEKDLNANLRVQLQKTQESNSELILAVHDLDEMLEQKNREILNLPNRAAASENAEELHEINSKSETNDDEEQKALEELIKEHTDVKEAHVLEQKIMDLESELEIYKRDKDELEMQMEQLALDYEILKQENHELVYKMEQSQLQEQLKMQYECSSSYATVNELENQIEYLENELTKQSKEFSDSLATISGFETHVKNLEDKLKKQSKEFSDSVATISGLETQVKNLEDELKKQSEEFSDSVATINGLETHVKTLEVELEKQAQGFEADLEALTRVKVELEKRSIQAEEALRKTRSRNANTAERLQEEFRRLSEQMASTFEANEKLAMKALTEAYELRMQKSHLEEMLQKAEEELKDTRELYEAKLHELSSQIISKTNQVEHQKKHEEEILMLRMEIERLRTEKDNLSKEVKLREAMEVELKQIKTSLEENEKVIQRGNLERNELGRTIILMRKETAKKLEELNIMRSLKDEKESIVGNLKMELESLKAQCNELKHSLSEDELEKEKLRKQIIQLKGDLKKKEDAFCSIEKKLKDSNGRTTVSEGTKANLRNTKSVPMPRGSKEVSNLKDKIKLLEAQIQLKETALDSSANSFLAKEKDLQDKIEELQRRLEKMNQNSTAFCGYDDFQKVAENAKDTILNCTMPEVRNAAENLNSASCACNENTSPMSLMKSNVDVISEKELEASFLNTRDQRKLDELLNEIALLNERNKSMEGELKEMQERYSEISLKFAEVEGERQQLVMTLRNVKNAKKTL